MDSAASSKASLSRPVPLPAAFWLALLFCCLAASGVAYAQTPAVSYDESEAQALDRMLMCPVCPAESIDQAQVPLARQMRQQVREMLAAGAGRTEILDWFAERYGPSVLAAPPKTGRNLLAWTLPVAGVIAALLAGVLALRAMTGRNRDEVAAPAAESIPDSELEPYLAMVDQNLARPPGDNSQAGDSGSGARDG